MREKFLFFVLAAAALFFVVSCSGGDDEGGESNTNMQCNSNIDCNRDSYCDLENPKQDAELGMLVYFCKKRQLCSTQADCPMNWKCKESEGFCITNKEADGVLCKSNDDCRDPNYPICNLSNGECRSYGGETGDDGDDIPGMDDYDNTDTEPDGDSGENDDDKDSAGKDDDVSDDDADTSSDPAIGKTVMTEDFEDGGANWTVVPAAEDNPCWKIGTPAGGPGEARSGSNVAATNLEWNYPANCKDLIYYNSSIEIPSEGKPEISFYAWVDLVGTGVNPFDYVEVLVKKSGDTWELVDSGLYLSADTPSQLSAMDNTRTKITKKLGTKYYLFIGDLSAFKGQSVDIGFRFTSDESDSAEGFYLDDIAVSY